MRAAFSGISKWQDVIWHITTVFVKNSTRLVGYVIDIISNNTIY